MVHTNKEDPPSYKESVSHYVPPPAYREREATVAANTNVTSNQHSNEDDQMSEMLNNVTESTEYGTIDSFDFQQLDDVLDGVDLSSDVSS